MAIIVDNVEMTHSTVALNKRKKERMKERKEGRKEGKKGGREEGRDGMNE